MRTFSSLDELVNGPKFASTSDPSLLLLSRGVSGFAVLARRLAKVADDCGIDVTLIEQRPPGRPKRKLFTSRSRLSTAQASYFRLQQRRSSVDLETAQKVSRCFTGILWVGASSPTILPPQHADSTCRTAILTDVTIGNHRAQNGWANSPWLRSEIKREAKLLSQFGRIYASSAWCEWSLVNELGLPEQSVSILPPSAFPAPGHDVAARNRSDSDVTRFITIGSPSARKGTSRVLAWLSARPSARVKVHIVGDVPPHDVDSRIVIHGQTDNTQVVEELLPTVDLLVHPTWRDQSAVTVVEAAMASVPSIASSVGGIGELIEHDSSGWLIPDDNDFALWNMLDLLSNDRSRLRLAGQAANERALARYHATGNYEPVVSWLTGSAS